MSIWHYVSVDAEGKIKKGILDGSSSLDIRQKLMSMGLTLIELVPAADRNVPMLPEKSAVRRSTLALLTFQIGTLLSAGLPLVSVLKDTSDLAENPRLREALLTIRSRVLEGHSLASGMDEFPGIFPALYRATIASGEKTGRLDEVIKKLARQLEKQELIRAKIQQALIYPALLTVVSVFIIGYLLTSAFPAITKTYTETGQTLPRLTLFLLHTSSSLKSYGIYLLPASVALFFYFRYLLKYERHRMLFQRMLLKIPILGNAMIIINAARFSRTLGILFAAGVPITEAMQTATGVITLLPMKAAVENAVNDVALGISIYQALRHSGYFTKMSTQLIAGGEASGELSKMLEKSADYQEQQVARQISAWLTVFEPILILLMGVIVLVIALAALLPVFHMNDLFLSA